MLDGAAKIGPLFDEAARLGMPAVGMTDYGNLYGADEFHQAATKDDIKPIIGIEAYVAPEISPRANPRDYLNHMVLGIGPIRLLPYFSVDVHVVPAVYVQCLRPGGALVGVARFGRDAARTRIPCRVEQLHPVKAHPLEHPIGHGCQRS